MNFGPRSIIEIFCIILLLGLRNFFSGQCQLLKEYRAISIPQLLLVIINMSPSQRYYLSIASISAIVTLALVTAILEVFQQLLNLPEEKRDILQSAALTGQVLLLVAQAVEKLHAGLRVTRDYQAVPQPSSSYDVSSVREELEVCIQPAQDYRSNDCTVLTQRSLSTYLSTQESIVSAEVEDN